MPSNNKFNSDLPTITDDHKEKPSHSVSSIYILLLLGFYILLAYVGRVMQYDMPAVIKEKDMSKEDWKTFSEESATKYLYRILGNQARVSGTKHHFVRARDLKWLLEEVTASSFNPVHTDWQYVSDNYWLAFNTPYVNSYNNVSNIIAVLEGESGVTSDTIGTSLLVNCHYDSVPFAIGASDNGVFCAAMVEILAKLSRRKQKFRHNIVFLFNGAEESPLMGSHGFLNHPWSKNLIGVVNLDSAGMNGRPSVFQVTDPRFLSSYRASRPTAQGLGQLLFESGIIPSDTDFRIFRDFGNITGMDIAFTEWGHVYHTRNDRPELIQNGVLQDAGDMLLGLLTGLADNSDLAVKEPPSPVVYYDYFHIFLITYSQTSAQIIDLLVSILGLTSVGYYLWLFGLRWSVMKDLLWSVVSRFMSIVAGVASVAMVVFVTILIDLCIASHLQMRYLSYNWMVVPLYWLPYFIAHTATSHYYESGNDNKMTRSIHTIQAMTATRLYLSVLLFILSFIPSLSNARYLFTVVVCLTSVCAFVSMSLVRYCRLSGLQHLLLEVALSIPLTLFTLSLTTHLVALLAPMMGRSGNDNPDLVIGGINAGLAVFVGFGLSGIELLCHTRCVRRALCVLLVLAALETFVPLAVYRGDVLQRHYWFHTQVTTYNASFAPIEVNSGVLITKLDPYTVRSAVAAIKDSPYYINKNVTGFIKDSDIKYVKKECDDVIYCNLPSYRPRIDKFMRNSVFINMEPPKEFSRSIKLVNKECGGKDCVLSFIMKGPSFNTIVLYSYFNITGWSFKPDVKPTAFFKKKPVYVIVHSSNTYVEFFEPLEFDITIEDWKTFSEESATKYLYRILGNQARVSGTKHHFVRARDLKWLLEEVTASSFNPVHTDWQYVSDNYWLAFNTPYVNSYNNVSNIIAVLEGESGVTSDTIGTSLLVNCHYDSVPFAIGASDNGVFCAAMVEILAKLSRRKQKFRHNIVFLFNGAEESPLMGSHGFLNHPWSKNLIGVVNLDSAGMNGRPSVFQVTDPRFLSSYRASRPTAQGLGQLLFESGIIPSDTDFRIFRDFGNITGMDIAFTEWGHVYHTRNDRPELIQNGVLQDAGDMLLGLLTGLADNSDLAVKEPPSPVVYYDYFHIFLITYSQTSAQIIDLLVSILGLTSVGYYLWLFGLRWSVMKDLLWSVVSRFMSIVAGVASVAMVVFVTILIDLCIASHLQMRYLSYNWMVVPLYWLPYFIAHTATSHYYESGNDNKMTRSIHTIQAMTATRLYLSVLLFILSFIPSLSNARYLFTVVVCLTSVCAFVSMSLVRYCRLSGLQHLLLEVALSIPLTLFTLSLATHLVALLAPMMGRSGNDNPDLVIGSINAGLAVFVGFGLSGIELLCHTRCVRRALCVLLVLAALGTFVPLAVYRGDVLQRHYWFHTQVTTYNASFAPIEVNSGVLITKLDPYTVRSAVAAIKDSPYYINKNVTGFIKDSDIKYVKKECDDVIYCNLPSYRPRIDKFMRNSVFINMEPPKEFSRSIKLVNKECGGKDCVLSFIMKGPSFNTIVLYSYFNITGWSFKPDVKPTAFFKKKPVYVIIHSSNTYVEFFEPLEFNITIEVPSSHQNESLVEISHNAHKLYHPEDFTEKYKNLLEHMPEYFNVATFLSFRDNYVF